MHPESYNEMKRFVDRFVKTKPLAIADVGAYDVNGTYRPLFDVPGWVYTGIDVAAGKNVTVVVSEPYNWLNVPSSSFDIVISGQTLEHVAKPWDWITEVARIAKVGAHLCIIAPHTFGFHEFPIDCWRVWPDGMKGLFEHAGLTPEKIYKNHVDTIGWAFKP